MKKIKFILGIHNHQPIGNFDFVFEDAYQKSYLPFLEVLEKHPKIRISLHFTGILLDWIEQNHPELIELVKKLRDRGQLEIMSGGYYEPIISVIPQQDRIGQIQKLTEKVKTLFNYDASGMWLAERVWEPTLPSTLHDAGIKYTVVDDTHFKYAGLRDEDLNGYFVTEDLGKQVNIFPISKFLRYTIPFQEPEETIKVLRNMASESGTNIMVFADDGEKFGVWPDTYKHVYENRWLDRFFSAIEENMDWIEMITFDEAITQVKPKSPIYLPTASYAEMMHWSLFKETFKAFEDFEHYLQNNNMYESVGLFVRGGFWRNFMSKYPEINVMHKKMLRVSEKLWQASRKNPSMDLKEAFDALWAGQCNCPYWHGVFGGLYLSHLRHAIFSNLIMAEKIVAEKDENTLQEFEVTDFDKDGRPEVLIETAAHNAYFSPFRGGNMFEYDFKAVNKNLLDTMTRREEGYHEKLYHATVVGQEAPAEGSAASIHDLVLAKEPGLEKYLIYDNYERKSFVDHFIGADVNFERFYRNDYEELGDFVNGTYGLAENRSDANNVIITLQRDGHVRTDDGVKKITVRKEISVARSSEDIEARYTLAHDGPGSVKLRFAVEFNYGLQAGHAHDRFYYNANGRLEDAFLDSPGELQNADYLGMKDEYMKIDIQLSGSDNPAIWRVPVETISLSEAGFERVYQSSAILLVWDLEIEKTREITIRQKVRTF